MMVSRYGDEHAKARIIPFDDGSWEYSMSKVSLSFLRAKMLNLPFSNPTANLVLSSELPAGSIARQVGGDATSVSGLLASNAFPSLNDHA